MQDTGSVLACILRALCRPFHVLCERIQHLHEVLLHNLNCDHHLSDAVQTPILYHLRCTWRLVPPLEDLSSSRTLVDLCAQHRMDHLVILLEFLTLARIRCLRASDRDATQNARRRESYITLCRVPRTLQVLLHS